jgi:hypothetical protein
LSFQTNLFGPVSTVVSNLNVGDILDIALLAQNQTPTVAVFTRDLPPQQAGTIAGARQLGDLVRCLQRGHTYEGEILKISGSTVVLHITLA